MSRDTISTKHSVIKEHATREQIDSANLIELNKIRNCLLGIINRKQAVANSLKNIEERIDAVIYG